MYLHSTSSHVERQQGSEASSRSSAVSAGPALRFVRAFSEKEKRGKVARPKAEEKAPVVGEITLKMPEIYCPPEAPKSADFRAMWPQIQRSKSLGSAPGPKAWKTLRLPLTGAHHTTTPPADVACISGGQQPRCHFPISRAVSPFKRCNLKRRASSPATLLSLTIIFSSSFYYGIIFFFAVGKARPLILPLNCVNM